jgi:O-antigen ligase
MNTILIIIGLAAFSYLAWRSNLWALALTVFALPSYLLRFSIGPLPTTFLEMMIVINFSFIFFRQIWPRLKSGWKKEKANAYPFAKEIIVFLLIFFAAAAIANFQRSALGLLKAYAFDPILFFISFFWVVRSRADWELIMKSCLASVIPISFFAAIQWFNGSFIANPFWAAEASRRVTSFFPYPNAVGLYLGPISLLAITFAAYLSKKSPKKNWGGIISLIIALLATISCYFAKSDGALIAVTAGLFFFLLFNSHRSRLLLLTLGSISVIALGFWPSVRESLWQKATLNDLSGKIRQQQWLETWQMLNDGREISGAGLGGYQEKVAPFHQEGIFFNSDGLSDFGTKTYASSTLRAKYWQPVEIYLYPHNLFLNFWSELGLVGLLFFLWLFGRYFFLLWKLKKTANEADRQILLGLAAAMLAIIVHGLVDVPYFKNDLAVFFWLLFAWLGWLSLEKNF